MRETLIKILKKWLVVLEKDSSKSFSKDDSISGITIQTALESQQQLFFKMLDNLPMLFHLQAPDYSIPYANKMFLEVFGDPSGKTCHKTMHGRDLPCEECTPFKIMQTEKTEENIWKANNGKTYLTVMTPFKSLTNSEMVMEMAVDISELKKTEKELIALKEVAEQANSAKTKFLSRMNHELRTPLNSVIGFSRLLLKSNHDPLSSNQKMDLERILDSGQQLLSLINEILDFSKLELGKTQANIVPVNANTIFNQVLHLANPYAEENSVELIDTTIKKQEYWVLADPHLLKQVLVNLFENAIKFNKNYGTVKLSCKNLSDNKLQIEIADTGMGIPADQHSSLFEPFNRVNSDFKKKEGTGLGLPICKELVELMGGGLDFNSHLGIGSCFFITLQTCQSNKTSEEEVIHPFSIKDLEITPKDSFDILYIEDNKMNRELIARLFSQSTEYNLIEAINSKEGVELSRKHKPDLILMDINLPGTTDFRPSKFLNSIRTPEIFQSLH